MIGIEEGEYFLTAKGRSADLRVKAEARPTRARSSRRSPYRAGGRRRSSTYRRRY